MNKRVLFDREKMTFFPVDERVSKVFIAESHVDPLAPITIETDAVMKRIKLIADEIVHSRELGAAVMLTFGAHAIKNGLTRVLGELCTKGWVTHLSTNGAGVIHDWEFAYLGRSSEDVRVNVQEGRFGTWEETGRYINLALAVGAYEGLGYGEAIGAMITRQGLMIPERKSLVTDINRITDKEDDRTLVREDSMRASAAVDLLELMNSYHIVPGFLSVPHPFSTYSIQALAYTQGVPFTSHPMFGHDIIYTHNLNRGSGIGRTAERDFLSYANSVMNLEGGVYLSVGSAIMSPMIFEKALSMARNVLLPKGQNITNCGIHVVDLQKETWDWGKGEPPIDNPAYYLRFMKTFNRMGCRVDYTSADNRIFLVGLLQELESRTV